MTLKELFTNIANAIRSATGATGTIKATDFASKISAITNRGAWTSTINAGGSVTVPAGYHNGSGKVTANANSGNAGTSQVLSGYTFYSNSATKQTGAMTNRGAVSTTIAPGGSYTIPAGYHNGSGVVSASSPSLKQTTQPTSCSESTMTINTTITNGILCIGAWKEGYSYKMYPYVSVKSGSASVTRLSTISNGYPNSTRGGMSCYRITASSGAVLRLWATGTENSSSADTGGCAFVVMLTN